MKKKTDTAKIFNRIENTRFREKRTQFRTIECKRKAFRRWNVSEIELAFRKTNWIMVGHILVSLMCLHDLLECSFLVFFFRLRPGTDGNKMLNMSYEFGIVMLCLWKMQFKTKALHVFRYFVFNQKSAWIYETFWKHAFCRERICINSKHQDRWALCHPLD